MSFSPHYRRKRVGYGMYKDHKDIITDTLDYYRSRTEDVKVPTPKHYDEIKQELQRTLDEGKRVLVSIKDSYNTQMVVIRLNWVGSRWARGDSVAYTEEGEVLVPYTIHYSDILCKSAKVTFITEGENPFAEGTV